MSGPFCYVLISDSYCFVFDLTFRVFIFFVIVFYVNFAVSVECVNICKFPKGEGNGKYDCSTTSCAWKAPRALTGFLASTAHSSLVSVSGFGPSGRRFCLRVSLLT